MESGETHVRAKGVAPVVRAAMTAKHFEVTEEDTSVFTHYALKPTMGFEMAINRSSRCNMTAINMKRRTDLVRNGPVGLGEPRSRSLFCRV